MKNYIFIFLAFIGLINFFTSCEKDETKTIMLANPVAPELTTVPELVLKRVDASKPLQFIGTKADFGFSSSVTYNLEADLAGNQFANPIVIASGKVDTFNISTTDLNSILIKTLPLDKISAMELRVRAILTVEASGANSIVANSEPKAVSITTYGPPSLTLTTAGTLQNITSPTDNKIYKGWIYTDGTGFQFTNKDDGKKYGGAETALVENGTAIALVAGAYNLAVDLNTGKMSMEKTDVTIGIIGNATNGIGGVLDGWSRDIKMTWNFTDQTWNINIILGAGGIKFRTHGAWSPVNVAYDPDAMDLNNLYQSNTRPNTDSKDIAVTAGTYNIKLYLATKPMKVVIAPSN